MIQSYRGNGDPLGLFLSSMIFNGIVIDHFKCNITASIVLAVCLPYERNLLGGEWET